MAGMRTGRRDSSTVMSDGLLVNLDQARGLALHATLLAGERRPAPDADAILTGVRRLGRLQLDPIRAVERSHLLVLWSRLGPFDRADLDRLLWEERRLFEYDAFVYPADEFAWAAARMDHFWRSTAALEKRARTWIAANDRFRRQIVERLRTEGPLPSRAFSAGPGVVPWKSSGWTANRNVTQMLHFLERGGQVMVAARRGNERLWHLPEAVLPAETLRARVPGERLLEGLIERAVRQRGIAELGELPQHITVADRAASRDAIARLIAGVRLHLVRVEDGGSPFGRDGALVHADDLALLEHLAAKPTSDRTTLLSPFDPLIADRDRTERLFGFRYRLDIYRPREQRGDGFYVLPILAGGRLVGRMEPVMDRSSGRLTVRKLRFEDGIGPADAPGLADAVGELAAFLGATEVDDRALRATR